MSWARCPIYELSTPAKDTDPVDDISLAPLWHVFETRMPIGPDNFLGYYREKALESGKYLLVHLIVRYLDGYEVVAVCFWDRKSLVIYQHE